MAYGQTVILVNRETGKELLVTHLYRASISVATSGDNEIVAAVSGVKIKVLSLFLISSGTVNLIVKSDVGGSAVSLTGSLPMIASSGFVLSAPMFLGNHWVETGVGKSLNINLSGNVQVGGCLIYYLE